MFKIEIHFKKYASAFYRNNINAFANVEKKIADLGCKQAD